ncbi:hypothetical protein DRW48_01040 [Paracoccus suum]|uniref:Sec-independent protein translocase protein TatA n=1 Tax=Paracoccus suum TaxID=2259340 RepID=A0A344PGG6_9RHOB|nr:twin-arginine translocase TatA/TatE family subunit [Paracoccus suum]AXC48471.1 hypothetical protein DRW48_01040 [Paracoccus suum]
MLNNIGLPGLLLIAVVILVMFGRGKVSSLMGEVGKGITAFKRGVNDGAKEFDDAATTTTTTTETRVITPADAEARAAERAADRVNRAEPRDITPGSDRV